MKRESQGKRKPPSLSPEIPVHLCHCADARMEPHLPALFWSIAQSHPTVSPLVHCLPLGGLKPSPLGDGFSRDLVG